MISSNFQKKLENGMKHIPLNYLQPCIFKCTFYLDISKVTKGFSTSFYDQKEED